MRDLMDDLLERLDTPEFKRAHREMLVREATAARTSITYLNAEGKCIQEWPATGEIREIELSDYKRKKPEDGAV